MSDNIPFDVQVEIIKRFPVKCLLQIRSVCKAWKSLIDSTTFIKNYGNQQQHLLVRYDHPYTSEHRYVSIVDDDTFPRQRVSLMVNLLEDYYIIGSAHGVLCLYDGKARAVLWNPSIRKEVEVAVVVPNVADRKVYQTTLGFGVCRETRDPKIVKITYISSANDVESVSCIPKQVEVFTLSTGTWRNPCSNRNLPPKSIAFDDHGTVVIDGVVYWLAVERVVKYYFSYKLIISFDMTSEEFRQVDLPDSIIHRWFEDYLTISKLRGSLVVLHCYVKAKNPTCCVVWMMEDGVPKSKSFTKLFTVNVNLPNASLRGVEGFRKSGVPIIQVNDDDTKICKLVVYEPYSKQIDDIGIDGIECFLSLYPYMETLLLLDQPDLMVYNDMSN